MRTPDPLATMTQQSTRDPPTTLDTLPPGEKRQVIGVDPKSKAAHPNSPNLCCANTMYRTHSCVTRLHHKQCTSYVISLSVKIDLTKISGEEPRLNLYFSYRRTFKQLHCTNVVATVRMKVSGAKSAGQVVLSIENNR